MLNNKQLNYQLAIFSILMFCSLIHPFHIHPLRNFYHDALSVVALVAGIACFGFVRKIELRIPSSVITPLALMIIVALQTWNGFLVLPFDSFYPLVDLLCLTLAIILGATIVSGEDGLKKLCFSLSWMFVAVGLVSLVFQLVQLAGFDAMPFVMPISDHTSVRPYANFGQPNMLALVMCFSVASIWWLYASRQLNKWAAVAIVISLLLGLVFTESRVVWIILPCFVGAIWRQPPSSMTVNKRTLLALLFLFAVEVVCVPHILISLGISVELLGQRAAHTSVRLILWKQAWAMSMAHPWFGVGWLQFGVYQVRMATMFAPNELVDYAHNIVLNFAAELGWPITVLILGSYFYWFMVSCLNNWDNLQVRLISLFFIAIMLHSSVEFPLWNAYILIPFGVMVGAVHSSRLGMISIRLAHGWIGTFVVLAAASIYIVNWDYRRVVNGFQALYWQKNNDPRGVHGTDKPDLTLFPQFFDYFQVDKIKIYQGMPMADIAFLEKMALSFGFPPVLERLALSYALNNRPNESLQVLITEQRLHPNFYPKTYVSWAEYAKQNPAQLREIYLHMPKPENSYGNNVNSDH